MRMQYAHICYPHLAVGVGLYLFRLWLFMNLGKIKAFTLHTVAMIYRQPAPLFLCRCPIDVFISVSIFAAI